MPEQFYRKDLKKPDGRRLHLYSRKPIADSIVAVNPPHEPITGRSHLRWHPLREEWVAYASHRQDRTFLPPKEYSPLAVTKSSEFPTELPAGDYDMAVFENLFSSLSLDPKGADVPELSIPTAAGTGVCEVVVFTQDPETCLSAMPLSRIELVLNVLGDRTREIGAKPEIQYVLPFENRGVEVGVTLHHPHGQIYSYPFVPPVVSKMVQTQKKFYDAHGKTLISDFLAQELKDGRRMIASGESTQAMIPVCARYPYETWIIPTRPVAYLHEMTPAETRDFARVLKTVLMKMDKMWDRPFPYLMAFYQAPTDKASHPEFHFHVEIYPPYRSRERLKFLAGTELAAGMFVNDCLPEEKAATLRSIEVSLGSDA